MSNDVNVKVAVRCRPMSSKEAQMGSRSIVKVADQCIAIENPNDPSDDKKFTFDYAYFTDSVQSQVYVDVAQPLVDQAFQGYNGTIFAYGQTGSGKTHTMMGTGDDHGIIPKMNEDLFRRVEAQSSDTTKFLITVSFLEIYNEVIKDLLNPSDKVLKIREHPDMGIYVEHLAELVVRDPADVTRLLDEGNKVRQVAATQMNERSSRSHSCFTIKIASKRVETLQAMTRQTMMNAKINLVDLAGSERAAKTGATGDRLKEGAAINKSLSALGNVINMLADRSKKGHVPYRDSKLTRLLQESLGGNSLTVMIAAVSPADYNFDESLGTLQYANRAKSIKNATRKNEDVNEKMIRELREEIERLRQMVQGGTLHQAHSQPNPEALRDMDEMIANLERAKQQSWEEKERLARLYEDERQKSLANDKNILAFMQTVKEEKIDGIKRVKALHQDKAKLAKAFRERKDKYGQIKLKLQHDIQAYQDALKANAADAVVQPVLRSIEDTKQLLIYERDGLGVLKERQKDIEVRILEEEADIATKSAVLQENEKLRQAIQEDERAKMQQEKEMFLEQALADERRRLHAQAEDERVKLDQILSESVDKEKRLAEEVIKQRNKSVAMSEEMHRLKHKYADDQTKTKLQLQDMLHGLQTQWLYEKNHLDEKFVEAMRLLTKAHADIVYLTKKNDALERQLYDLHEQQHRVKNGQH
ncbi:hypothetical protein H257_10587 [Aphanomyces astaci]|uniref:Kinesin-like protein n=2 Tax=Aphanomyces astaci TaxID=112090 RepID=W4G5J2_APHAT|nr:hypothetical protein H257_10587 [Aphanomyces astaci]ETV74982.1 hypothetical protein H257_10587 [Aphanomyces astaci]|eukprot:XP_009835486.1 hypothetical protein H257_10587 [Aphanomyces astaci]